VTNVTPTCGILASISLPTSGLRKAYSSTGASVAITERFNQTPCFYRVKASRSGYFDSGWQTGDAGVEVKFSALAPILIILLE
jgi:hypothetical protein